jgi:hypothetical protein
MADLKLVANNSETDDESVFVLDQHVIKTVSGEEIRCPKVTWRKELQVIAILKDLLGKVVSSGVLSGVTTEEEGIAKVLDFVFTEAPNMLEAAVNILTGQSKEWIADNLVIEEMVGLVIPFLYSKRVLVEQMLKPYLPAVAQQIDAIQARP